MARIRTTKPEFWTSQQVVECSRDARLLFIGLWNFCDDAGRHPASAMRLKMEVLPADDVPLEVIRDWINELLSHDLIRLYVVSGQQFWQVTGWHHQRIDKPNVRFPAPTEFVDHSTNGIGTVGNHSTPEPEPEPEMDLEGKCNRNRNRKPGACAKTVFGKVTTELLRDTAGLLAWLVEAAAIAETNLHDSEADRLNVLGISERCLEHGKKPAALFVSLVRKCDWAKITHPQENRARDRLRDYKGTKVRGRDRAAGPSSPQPVKNAVSRLAKLAGIDGNGAATNH